MTGVDSDVNLGRRRNFLDFEILQGDFGCTRSACQADIDHDGSVDLENAGTPAL